MPLEPILYTLLLTTLFVLPVLAAGWLWLAVIGLVCLSPAIFLLVEAQFAPDTAFGADFLAFMGIAIGIAPLAGTLSRVASLLARRRALFRPRSLWIEAVGALAALLGYFLLLEPEF